MNSKLTVADFLHSENIKKRLYNFLFILYELIFYGLNEIKEEKTTRIEFFILEFLFRLLFFHYKKYFFANVKVFYHEKKMYSRPF